MNETVIVTSKEEIEKIVLDAFDKAVERLNSKTEPPDEPQMLNVQQAAKFTGLAVPTVYDKTSRKQIPHHKKGKKLYFLKAELEEWIMSGNKVKTEQELESEAATYCLSNRK